MDTQTKVTGVILAGGLARRMGNQDKGLVRFKGKPLISYAIAAMGEVADETIINANCNLEGYQQFGLPVIGDQTDSFDGPLAGVLAAMLYNEMGVLLVMPCDSPYVRACHLQKLLSVRSHCCADVAVAFDGKRLHPVFLALNAALMPTLQAYLDSGQRKVETWLEQQKLVKVDFSNEAEMFININSMAELTDLEKTDGLN
jgi:molybdopterin-guanine dinucleotide biosynthesis protein A